MVSPATLVVADCPAMSYLSNIKYQKYKSVELGDQLCINLTFSTMFDELTLLCRSINLFSTRVVESKSLKVVDMARHMNGINTFCIRNLVTLQP